MIFAENTNSTLGTAAAGILQSQACSIGPRVGGVAAGRAAPLSMGAFTTFASEAACRGYSQQQEQHMPTTTTARQFGDAMTQAMTSATSAGTQQAALSKLAAIRQSLIAPIAEIPQRQVPPLTPPPTEGAPPPSPEQPTEQPYPPGTIYAVSQKMPGWYRIAVPRTVTGFGAAPEYEEVAPSQTVPPGATPTTETELEKKTGKLPWYKKWQVWAAIGGVVVVGGGAAIYVRRRKQRM
jgi:hypothetical protein